MNIEHEFQSIEHASGKRESLQIADIATFDEALLQLLAVVWQEYPDLAETAIFQARCGTDRYSAQSGWISTGSGYKYFKNIIFLFKLWLG